ncbi:hypothetical protein EIP86_009489 [Pleurotus ostreatoroseus]|nr:hypothetical protein EIP86_009489 [Pleurotus ostreatoroseus]
MASRPASPDQLSASSTRPSSRTDRRIRFAEVTPQDVHVYESAPPSPKKRPLALPPPSNADGPTISLGEWKSRGKEILLGTTQTRAEEPLLVNLAKVDSKESEHSTKDDEGTPEDIRRRFFPNVAPHDPSLAWIENPDPETEGSTSGLRFDLSGTPIPPDLSEKLPTHLGLHHHAEGSHAGYTLDDIFLLSRSTVPAQRASMLDVLGKIARRLSNNIRGKPDGITELKGQEVELRKRIVAAGVEAMGERGSLGARAVEAMWACIVFWDENLLDIEGVELKGASGDAYASLPFDYILERISEILGTASLPPESLLQLLGIIHRLAQESNQLAGQIVSTPELISHLVTRFLLTPIPPTEGAYPVPLALETLTTLALASRTNASSLAPHANGLLRFIVTLPSSSPFPEALATSLLSRSLDFYRTLAWYGLRSHISATASEPLFRLGQYVLSEECTSSRLRRSWLGVLEAWIKCAQDPHHTTPSHDIVWSQVVGWNWSQDVLDLRSRLTGEDVDTWAALWKTEAAWLEGSGINAVKAGEAEKTAAIAVMRGGFEHGMEKRVVDTVGLRLLDTLNSLSTTTFVLEQWRDTARYAGALSAVLRLWLSCLPPPSAGPLASPPFLLPFASISALCARLTTHPLWDRLQQADVPSYAAAFPRPVSRLLGAYLHLSRVLPGSADDLWLAQTFSILTRLFPGDEEMSVQLIENAVSLVNPAFMTQRGWNVPAIIWEKGTEPIVPFLTYALRHNEVYVGPLWMTPASIAGATTQRLSAAAVSGRDAGRLPLNKDWVFTPLDHLLRSGQSEVFKSLPSSWDASETEVVRATLLLAKVQREVLRMYGLASFALSREEMVFACMKVFMLEHGQQQMTSVEEVFRDSIVEHLMNDLLAPFTIAAASSIGTGASDVTLDVVAKGFLGLGTPFYQWYTDFVALYDAISFSHPLFARLLLPPLSMRYATDFRKYFWADYGHVLRTVKVPVDAVVASGVEEFLYPVEVNAEVLAAYLRALVKDQVEGFLRLVAVHHITCNIWPDSRQDVDANEGEERAIKLLQALSAQGSFDAVRDVVFYHQTLAKAILPPACFTRTEELLSSRKEFASRCGSEVLDRLDKLLH